MDTISEQQHIDYQRIEKAIRFIEANFQQQPSLAEIAEHVALSEFHFNRLFSRWAGTSPQRFLRFLTKEFAKERLAQSANLLDTTLEAGLSSTSRLHDLFVTYEAMTPAEFKHQGQGLTIHFGIHETPFGACFIAVTARGVMELRFLEEDEAEPLTHSLQQDWINATWIHAPEITQSTVNQIFDVSHDAAQPITVLLRGTNFQIKVWEALLSIPKGQLASYEQIAQRIGQPSAHRAVGTAIGSNRIAYLIPCHRVLQKVGGIGGYRWGITRKKAILGWEMSQIS
ncbi:AraC family transcriptional regulator of adaptative response/methylated-DNA-[protein]-cysteine methyltransferase [Runella defluvii]|uniref:methylated-DNA--[protein]-cysteine S-methyltransferase n=1 Tax=Runella defluvii TaxID=370973 RepID=A0A7W6EPW1_9BACT|nr:methylated-DNA--[protein]-cysteine S-methyltransferase [Runella defluvii]MBB3837989.1 AraC family transcriptional regulator of adaptative response/methylated-DNA-[protein]-cysteine methyltransferase [Runella defluvii]